MKKLLKKDFKDVKLLTDMWVMTAYLNFFQSSLWELLKHISNIWQK